jgi:hypothetical protein
MQRNVVARRLYSLHQPIFAGVSIEVFADYVFRPDAVRTRIQIYRNKRGIWWIIAPITFSNLRGRLEPTVSFAPRPDCWRRIGARRRRSGSVRERHCGTRCCIRNERLFCLQRRCIHQAITCYVGTIGDVTPTQPAAHLIAGTDSCCISPRRPASNP